MYSKKASEKHIHKHNAQPKDKGGVANGQEWKVGVSIKGNYTQGVETQMEGVSRRATPTSTREARKGRSLSHCSNIAQVHVKETVVCLLPNFEGS